MLEKFTHTNSKNEVLDFFSFGIYANYNDLRDYEWKVVSDNGRITGFKRDITKKKLPFVFVVDEERANEIKDAFFEHFEIDVLNGAYGFFTVNGYKYHCYATKSVKAEYLRHRGYLKLTLELTTDKPYWSKDTVHTIDFANNILPSDALKYAFTYPFTYRSQAASVVNDFFAETDGIIRIYGEAINPLIKINSNVYQVNATVESGEYLEIDTEEKTIFKYSSTGVITNMFNYRNKMYDVFKPLPSGNLQVSANATFKADIVIREKRGEPKWTSSIQTRTMRNAATYAMLR